MKDTPRNYLNLITTNQKTSETTIIKNLRLIELLNFIFNNYTNPELNLKMIQEHLYCYKEYLYSVCTIFFGMGIMELVETVRLHKSIILIFSGECKVWGKVGYTSIFVFSKAFKRRTGMNILEVKRTLSTKSIEQINNLYIHLINIVWKSRYEVFKEIATFDESEITSENWKMFINYDK